jgi:hypothetical protein
MAHSNICKWSNLERALQHRRMPFGYGHGNDCLLHNSEQQADETPMVWSVLIWIYLIYEPDWHHNRY